MVDNRKGFIHERLLHTQEVHGSSPCAPTTLPRRINAIESTFFPLPAPSEANNNRKCHVSRPELDRQKIGAQPFPLPGGAR